MENFADTVTLWVSMYAVKLVVALAIFIIGKWLAKWVTALIDKAMRKATVEETLIKFLTKLTYYILMVVVLITAAGQLGIKTTSLLTILAAGGLAVGLALKDSLSNFASGVMIILFRPFKVGDFITAAGSSGSVRRIDIFNTVLMTGDNQRIIIPNSAVTGGAITNVNSEETRRIDLVMGIGYDDDIREAKAILQEIVKGDSRILDAPAPTIAVAELADSSVNFVVRPWVKTADYWAVRFDLTEKIKLTFDEKGISIPYPQQDVHMYQENAA
ncbi:MAG: mechanosensitive ion channel [Desulfobulbaceae bacterium]|uniref:Mechanosensitive ion channel n=1 Tax=Candidatus Desulfobia pelagia TaxID=2841692 RepID=A0A8J6NA91_9BACT|nr:mechanosensitive ion channel [Candidatus Desulfobia pelagia]